MRGRTLAYAALGVLWMLPFWTHPFACPFGLHDWAYPCVAGQRSAYLPSLVAPWWDTDLGLAHALPQVTPPWLLLGALVAISPAVGLRLFLLGAFVASAIAADVAADRLFRARDGWARLIAGAFYAASPFLATKLASGHLGFLMCAPLLPAALIALDACAPGADRVTGGAVTARRAWAACALCAASAFAQVQCGVLLLALLPVAAWRRVGARYWLGAWAVAVAVFSPAAYATIVAYRSGVFAPETQLAVWLADKSVPWQHAIDGTAYFARYFQDAAPSMSVLAWEAAALVGFIAALARAGVSRRLAVAALLLGAFATGTVGPLSAWIGALFAQVPALSIFREFYDLLFLAPLVVAGGAAIVADAVVRWRPQASAALRLWISAAAIAAAAVLLAPAVLGDLASLVPFVDIEAAALPPGDDRVMWLPVTPPVGPHGSRGGADPYQVAVDGHPAATAFHPTGVLAYAGALADRGGFVAPALLARMDVVDVVDRPAIFSQRLSRAAHPQGGDIERTSTPPPAPRDASVLAIADGLPACEPDLRSALAASLTVYRRCANAWSIVRREDAASSEDDPAAGWIDGERWALLDPSFAQPRWPVLFTRSRVAYSWTQPQGGTTWIYAPHGARLDGRELDAFARWRPVATRAGAHSLRGDGDSLVAIAATVPFARTAARSGAVERPLHATMSDRDAGAFDADLAPHGQATIVLREGWSNGWRASIDGRDLGAPLLADGYAAGWTIGAAARPTHLSIRYAPATPYFILLGVSIAAALAAALTAASVIVVGRRGP